MIEKLELLRNTYGKDKFNFVIKIMEKYNTLKNKRDYEEFLLKKMIF